MGLVCFCRRMERCSDSVCTETGHQRWCIGAYHISFFLTRWEVFGPFCCSSCCCGFADGDDDDGDDVGDG